MATLSSAASAQTYIIVRHGETLENDGSDRRLSPEGTARAESLKEVIKGTKPDLVISSHFRRTLQTATAFTGDENAVEIVALDYDPSLPFPEIIANYVAKLTQRLLEVNEDKVVLVSTHGHVLSDLVENLSGVRIPHKDCEHDHLVTITKKGDKATVTHGRYGEASAACKE